MELAEHVADDRCALARLRVRAEAELVHRVQDAALDRLLAVGDLGQRAALDDGDRVVEVRALGVVAERQDVVARVGTVGPIGRGVVGREQRGLLGHRSEASEGSPSGAAGGATDVRRRSASGTLRRAGIVTRTRAGDDADVDAPAAAAGR